MMDRGIQSRAKITLVAVCTDMGTSSCAVNKDGRYSGSSGDDEPHLVNLCDTVILDSHSFVSTAHSFIHSLVHVIVLRSDYNVISSICSRSSTGGSALDLCGPAAATAISIHKWNHEWER